jgi:Flp pilus assembly protein TadG
MRLIDFLFGTARRLQANTGGAVIVPLALALPVLFGFGMLVIDAGRYYNLQTSLQGGADALALAGAAELDAKSDSIVRANRAIDTLVSNDQRFGEGTGAISRARISVRFLTSMPATDAEAITSANETTDPLKAGFVEVNVQPVTFRNIFASAVNAVSAPTQTQASAVAGFDSVACNVAPLFMCNPFEGGETSIYAASREAGFPRRLIAMKAKGNQYGSGNYGYLEPADGNGGAAVREALAIDQPRGCYKLKGVELQTGNIASTAEAMNVRFDIYEGNFDGKKNDPAYRPARNVRKGYTGSQCNRTVSYTITKSPTDAENLGRPLGLPRDACLYTGTCTYGGAALAGRMGDGNWDFETYWSRTHSVPRPNGWSNSNRPTRYEVYRYEIDNNLVSTATANGTPSESGAPMCYSGDTDALSDTPDRRVFVGAIINCQAAAEAGQLTGSSGGTIPVEAYAKFFLTEPMDKNDGTIWAEMIQVVEPGTAAARNIIRDSVQLMR